DYAFVFLFRLEQPGPWQRQSIGLAIDERTRTSYGGLIGMRGARARGLERLRDAHPRAVAVDVILPEAFPPEIDAKLEQAFAHTRNLVLSCDLLPDGSGWEEPIDRF